MRVTRSIWGWASLLVALAGCSVGPNYHAPKPQFPAEWLEAKEGTLTNATMALAAWWTNFNDATLDSLVGAAIRSNYDLKAAEARLRAGRALRGAVLSDFLPAIDANGSYTKARRSQNALAFPVRLIDTETYQAGFDASWEIDVFGGKRRALEAVNADLQAIEEDRRMVLVSVVSEVARNYIQLRGTQQRLGLARKNLGTQQETLEITQQRFKAGLAADLEVSQARAVFATTRSQLPQIELMEKEYLHRLSLLLGKAPGELGTDLESGGPIPPTPPEIPAGLPSDLLRRRPDVRRAERQLAAATARIGVATAELFPKFSLTGVAGFQSLRAANLISPGSEFWSFGPSVRWRILEYPRLRAQVRAQNAQQEQALAQFQQTVLTSLEEVENALVAYEKEKERQAALIEAVDANRRAFDLANQVYTSGVAEFLNVLVAARSLYEAEDALAQSRGAVSVNLVALYKALGGGWESEANTP
ncbi:MAG: outer membrane protein multidrug efflux system [Verrucomicrobiota bacterium]|jgi:NodT family efflux transporter outer membrane factor (OMF) lipoprotein